MLKIIFVSAAVALVSGATLASTPECELDADRQWLEQSDFEGRVTELGYVINDLLVSEGNCFEVTGLNDKGEKMRAYFHPQTAEMLHEEAIQ